MNVDWKGIGIALFVTFLMLFIFLLVTDMAGLCLKHENGQNNCIADASGIATLAPLSLSVAFIRLMFLPIIAFSVGMLYYFRGHPIEDWADVVLPSCVIGGLAGMITLFLLTLSQSPLLEDFLYLFMMFSWVGFFIATAITCALIGGILTYSFHKKI